MASKRVLKLLVGWNLFVTCALLVSVGYHLLPGAWALGAYGQSLLGGWLDLQQTTGVHDPVITAINNAGNNLLKLQTNNRLDLGLGTGNGFLAITTTVSSPALAVYQGGQASPLLNVQSSSSGLGGIDVRTDNDTAFRVIDDGGNADVFWVDTNGTNEVHSNAILGVKAHNDNAFLVEDTDNSDVFRVDTNGTKEIHCGAPLHTNEITTETAGGDLVITLQ